MGVLVLRAAMQAECTAARLMRLGREPVLAPLLEIVATHAPAPSSTYDVLMATSRHALETLSFDAEALCGLKLFAVGERTAAAARARGFLNIGAVAKDASSLLNDLLGSPNRWSRALYLAGLSRRPDIELGLKQAGRHVDVLVTYEARAASNLPSRVVEMIRTSEIEAALHYSQRSAALFVKLVRDAGLETPASKIIHVAISQNAAAPLRGFACDLRVAASPDEASLLATLAEKSSPDPL